MATAVSQVRRSGFSSHHREAFQALLPIGELYAFNEDDQKPIVGPWVLGCNHLDTEIRRSLRARFRAAARGAAIACHAPRGHLLNWWISELARGENRPYIRALVQRSIEYCEQLESNAAELQPIVGLGDSPVGLSRDRYLPDSHSPYWLYEMTHDPLPNPLDEFAFWSKHVWDGFNSTIQQLASRPHRGRRWIDRDGKPQVELKENTRARVGKILALRSERLDAFIDGLSYDLAVLQANYVLDRGLRAQDATDTFNHEMESIIEQLHEAWLASSKLLGLSTRKQVARVVDFARPGTDVRADLQCLLSDIDLHEFRGGKSHKNAPTLREVEAYRRGLDNLDRLLTGLDTDEPLSLTLQKQISGLFTEMAEVGILTAQCEIDAIPSRVRFQIHAVRPTIEAMIENLRRQSEDLQHAPQPDPILHEQEILASGLDLGPSLPSNGLNSQLATRKRGRKAKFTQQQLENAYALKSQNKSNNEVAKALYGASPTEAQRRSVPTILRHHFTSKK